MAMTAVRVSWVVLSMAPLLVLAAGGGVEGSFRERRAVSVTAA
jgi:hypothetical protein